MAEGLEVYNTEGTKVLSTLDMTWNILGFKVVSAHTATSINLTGVSDFTMFEGIQSMLIEIPDNQKTKKASISIVKTIDALTVSIVTYQVGVVITILGR